MWVQAEAAVTSFPARFLSTKTRWAAFRDFLVRAFATAIEVTGPPALHMLVLLLGSSNDAISIRAVEAMEALKDRVPGVRRAAREALNAMKGS